MDRDTGENSKYWKFIGGNFAINSGEIINIEFLDIEGNTHYKFDLRIFGEGFEGKTIRDIVSCPYLHLEESEHRLIFEDSRVAVICKFTPEMGNATGRILFSGKIIALKVEDSLHTLWRIIRMTF